MFSQKGMVNNIGVVVLLALVTLILTALLFPSATKISVTQFLLIIGVIGLVSAFGNH